MTAFRPKTKLRSTPPLLLRALGVTNPTVRELLELRYEFQEPFIVDSTKIATKLEVHATPLDQALAGTLAAYRANPASSARRAPEGAVEDQPARPWGGPPPDRGEHHHGYTECNDARPCDRRYGRPRA